MTTLMRELVLGFLPVHGGKCERGSLDALQEGRVAPASVNTSVSAEPTRISPDPQKTTTLDNPYHSTKLAAHQHALPG
jgi:hypothetical protein